MMDFFVLRWWGTVSRYQDAEKNSQLLGSMGLGLMTFCTKAFLKEFVGAGVVEMPHTRGSWEVLRPDFQSQPLPSA